MIYSRLLAQTPQHTDLSGLPHHWSPSGCRKAPWETQLDRLTPPPARVEPPPHHFHRTPNHMALCVRKEGGIYSTCDSTGKQQVLQTCEHFGYYKCCEFTARKLLRIWLFDAVWLRVLSLYSVNFSLWHRDRGIGQIVLISVCFYASGDLWYGWHLFSFSLSVSFSLVPELFVHSCVTGGSSQSSRALLSFSQVVFIFARLHIYTHTHTHTHTHRLLGSSVFLVFSHLCFFPVLCQTLSCLHNRSKSDPNLKVMVHPKMKILSAVTHACVILSSVGHNRRC